MKIALYKGKQHLFNKAVAWWTRGPYSHVELILDDNVSVSSSFRDGGVRYKQINYSNTENWDFIEIGPEPEGLRAKIDEILDQKYDWMGLIGFVFRRVGDDRKKLFCSESVMYLLGYSEPWRFDPNTLTAVFRKEISDGRISL